MRAFVAVLPFAALLLTCAHEEGKALNVQVPATPASTSAGPEPGLRAGPERPPDQTGLATWYGASFAGKKTTNGERFDPRAMTAAHRSLPFGTWVEVRRPDTGTAVRVRINDRGPRGDRRKIIDVSQRAAEILGIVPLGSARVELRIVDGP